MEDNSIGLKQKIVLFIVCVVMAFCFMRVNAIEGTNMFAGNIHDILYGRQNYQKTHIDGDELFQKLKFWEDNKSEQH